MDKRHKKKKKIIDLRRFMDEKLLFPDESGAYTGVPTDSCGSPTGEQPVQDADDL